MAANVTFAVETRDGEIWDFEIALGEASEAFLLIEYL